MFKCLNRFLFKKKKNAVKSRLSSDPLTWDFFPSILLQTM